jgi:hypothetical protein
MTIIDFASQLPQQVLESNKGQHTHGAQDKIAAANQYAVASSASYIHYNDAQGAKGTQDYIDEHMPGWEMETGLSTKNATVLSNKTSRKAIISYRGTDIHNVDDLVTDYQLATHGWDYGGIARFDDAVGLYDTTANALSGYDVSVTGHSLGGTQAMWVSEQRGAQAHVFNPGVVGPTINQELGALKDNPLGTNKDFGARYDNIHVYRTNGDVVSGGWWSLVGNEKDDNGQPLESTSSWLRPQGDHGIDLVITPSEDPHDHSGAHNLDTFLTDSQRSDYALRTAKEEPEWASHQDKRLI